MIVLLELARALRYFLYANINISVKNDKIFNMS